MSWIMQQKLWACRYLWSNRLFWVYTLKWYSSIFQFLVLNSQGRKYDCISLNYSLNVSQINYSQRGKIIGCKHSSQAHAFWVLGEEAWRRTSTCWLPYKASTELAFWDANSVLWRMLLSGFYFWLSPPFCLLFSSHSCISFQFFPWHSFPLLLCFSLLPDLPVNSNTVCTSIIPKSIHSPFLSSVLRRKRKWWWLLGLEEKEENEENKQEEGDKEETL